MCAKSGHFTTAPCLNRKSMHHFVREGGSSPKSLPSVQSPGARPTKKTLKTCSPRGKETASPQLSPVTQFQGQWGRTMAPGQSLPYCNTQHAHIFSSSPPKPPVSHRVQVQERHPAEGKAREGTDGARPGKNREQKQPHGLGLGTRSGALQEID